VNDRTQIRELLGLDLPRTAEGRVCDGLPGIRDIDARCDVFRPGEPAGTECAGDGHYLCAECTEWAGRGYEDGEAVYVWHETAPDRVLP
jgi:hypothetical protein